MSWQCHGSYLYPISGLAVGRIGRKRMIVGFALASVLRGFAANFDQSIAFRMLQGIIGAPLVVFIRRARP